MMGGNPITMDLVRSEADATLTRWTEAGFCGIELDWNRAINGSPETQRDCGP
jgi:hypothetical protein